MTEWHPSIVYEEAFETPPDPAYAPSWAPIPPWDGTGYATIRLESGTPLAFRDEFDEYLAEQMRNPLFAAAFRRDECRHPRPLCIDGREYRRRQAARKRRR